MLKKIPMSGISGEFILLLSGRILGFLTIMPELTKRKKKFLLKALQGSNFAGGKKE